MKYSIIMAAYNRSKELAITLQSFAHYGSRNENFELVVVIDSKSNDIDAVQALLKGRAYRVISDIMQAKNVWNSCLIYNHAASLATGDNLIVQNPECFHKTNILSAFDRQDPDAYVVASCLDAEVIESKWPLIKMKPLEWYQHSKCNNRQLHFCSRISRDNWDKVGGFSPEFSKGMWYEDNDFIMKIRAAGIPVISDDTARVIHQHHGKGHWYGVDAEALKEINKQLYISKWER